MSPFLNDRTVCFYNLLSSQYPYQLIMVKQAGTGFEVEKQIEKQIGKQIGKQEKKFNSYGPYKLLVVREKN